MSCALKVTTIFLFIASYVVVIVADKNQGEAKKKYNVNYTFKIMFR